MAFPEDAGITVPSGLIFGPGADGTARAANTAAINTALQAYPVVLLPAQTIYCSGAIEIPYGVELRGATFNPSYVPANTDFYRTTLVFPATLSSCVVIKQTDPIQNTPLAISNIHISREAMPISPTTEAYGIDIEGGYNVRIENVMVSRQYVGYRFKTNIEDSAGISAKITGIYSAAISKAHILIDSWPELYITGGRLGQSGPGDVACTSFIRVTGGSGPEGGAQGPNTIFINQVQFNQSDASVTNWLEFNNLVNVFANARLFKFEECYIENITGSFIAATGSTPSIADLTVNNCSMLDQRAKLMSLPKATAALDNVTFSSCGIACSGFTLNQDKTITNLIFSSCYITVPLISPTVAGTAADLNLRNHSTVRFSDTSFGGNVYIAGDLTSVLQFSNPIFTAGSFQLRPRADRKLITFISNFGAETDAIGLSINGNSTGFIHSFKTAAWQFSGNKVEIDFRIGITARPTSPTGQVAIGKLPVPFDLDHYGQGAGGGIVTLMDNVTGLTSPMVLSPTVIGGDALYMGLWMSSSTGLAPVTNANLNPSTANPTRLFGTLSYTF
ncbi:hypothetical protein [Sphingobium yanoikuyae]|uniref:hypothetical protein n=1 Tax=Sphingobium yanoikuyae TaxID=13690 RepID=UPI00345EDB04